MNKLIPICQTCGQEHVVNGDEYVCDGIRNYENDLWFSQNERECHDKWNKASATQVSWAYTSRPVTLGVTASAPTLLGSPEFYALLEEIRTLHSKKSQDYGADKDPLANLRGSEEYGIPAWKSTFSRMMDKVQRIKSYCLKGSLANEGVEDAFKDLAVYSLLALVLFRETQGAPK